MTGGNMFGLDGIQSDDELLDRLAARESDSDDELEALLGAWVREIEEDAEEVAGTPMPWMGQARPKPRSVKVHRAAAVAGALVVTLSGGMAAVAFMPPESQPAPLVGVLQGMSRILPKPASTTATTVTTVNRGHQEQAAPVQIQPKVGTQQAAQPVAEPSQAWTPVVVAKPSSGPGLPPLTPTTVPNIVPNTASTPPTVSAPPSSPSGQPTTQPAPGTGTSGAPQTPTSEPAPPSSPTEQPSTSTGTGSPEPTPSKTSPTPTPPDVKDSSPVTTPGGVLTEPGTAPATETVPEKGEAGDKPEPAPSRPSVPAPPAGSIAAPVIVPEAAAGTLPAATP